MSRYSGKMMTIDGEKLNALIEETGKSISKISRELGHSDGVLRQAIKRGTISVPDAVLLERQFKIKQDLYVIKPVNEDTEQTETRQSVSENIFTEDVLNSLHKVIYSAVYSAFKKALE